MKELSRSVADEVIKPFNIELLEKQIKEECNQVVMVKDMGNYKAPIMFDSKDEAKRIRWGWGRVVQIDDRTKLKQGFDATRILTDTGHFTFIQGWIYLSVGGVGFDVHTREIVHLKDRKSMEEIGDNPTRIVMEKDVAGSLKLQSTCPERNILVEIH